MAQLEQILLQHALRYPEMEPEDGVKLIYQNEFGGGHLITNEQACLVYLRREYASTPRTPRLPAAEDIGNGILRVNLGAIPEAALMQLGQDFIHSAREHSGTRENFLRKLDILRSLADTGNLPFSRAELEAYLKSYLSAGCPRVSHSNRYRYAYHPAYRVITADHYFAHRSIYEL